MKGKRLMKFKIRYILYAALLFLLYFIVGAIIPFAKYKKMSEDTISNLKHEEIITEEGSIDRAMLLETNLSAWEERIRLLNLAEEKIVLSTFSIADGESTRDIASILLKKADQGVKVYIFCDGFNGRLNIEGSDFFYSLSSHENIEIKLYNRVNLLLPWKAGGRMHDKYLLVDDIAYILGGRNTFDYFIGDYEQKNQSYDREVLIYNTEQGRAESINSSIWEIYDYFEDIWNYKECRFIGENEKLADRKKVKEMRDMLYERYESLIKSYPELFAEYDYIANTYKTDGIVLLSNPTGLYGKEPVVFYQMAELMKMAKESVIIHTPYAVCDSYMYEKLAEIKNMVPECRMMINSVENGDNFVASSDYLRNKKDVVKTGIPILEYDGGISYHAKSVVIDDLISIIGSFNIDIRSTYVDTELMLVIKSTGLTKELTGYMEELEKDCRIVVDKTKYITPEHVVVADIPFAKRLALRAAGLVLQLVRFLI